MRPFWKLEGIIHPKKIVWAFLQPNGLTRKPESDLEGFVIERDCREQNTNQAFITLCQFERVDYQESGFSKCSSQVEYVR